MKRRRRYTDQQRADLVVMLISEGYPDKKGALQKVADYAKMPAPTLHRWFHEKNNPAPSELVNEKAFDLRAAIQQELAGIFATMPSARKDAEYGDLSRAAGILTDKMLLLDGKATEHVKHEHSGQLTIDERRQRITDILNADRELRRATGLSATDD